MSLTFITPVMPVMYFLEIILVYINVKLYQNSKHSTGT